MKVVKNSIIRLSIGCLLFFLFLGCGGEDDEECFLVEETRSPVGNFVVEGAPAGITAELITYRCQEGGY